MRSSLNLHDLVVDFRYDYTLVFSNIVTQKDWKLTVAAPWKS